MVAALRKRQRTVAERDLPSTARAVDSQARWEISANPADRAADSIADCPRIERGAAVQRDLSAGEPRIKREREDGIGTAATQLLGSVVKVEPESGARTA